MVASNPDGVDKVENSNGKYAFFMESSSIEYLVERRCKLAQVHVLKRQGHQFELQIFPSILVFYIQKC